jgi:hypothetical protein
MSEELEIRAAYDEEGLFVYQAYCPEIGLYAAEHGRFGRGFKLDRMTWIKPSFGWMLYRCGYGRKPGQEVVLRIKISHQGWLEALLGAVLSKYKQQIHGEKAFFDKGLKVSECRVQWDPDRSLALGRLERRAIQVGLRGAMVERYARDWILAIDDVTELAHEVRDAVAAKTETPVVPAERIYQVAPEIRQRLGM